MQFSVRDGRLNEYSTEEERYELLKNAYLTVKPARIDRLPSGAINGTRKTEIVKAIKNIARQLGIDKLNLRNSKLDMEFGFSIKNVGVSASHQTEYGGDYEDFLKALSCIEDLAYNAIPIEMHTDKKAGTNKANPDLKMVYVFVTAYSEGNSIVPLQMEVKEFTERKKGLYLNVALKKIESGVWDTGRLAEYQQGLPYLLPDSKIRISDIFRNVNPESDARFLKYVPDDFLNEEQKRAKLRALDDQNREYSLYQTRDPYAVSDRELIAKMLDALAAPEQVEYIEEYRKLISELDAKSIAINIKQKSSMNPRYRYSKGSFALYEAKKSRITNNRRNISALNKNRLKRATAELQV